MQIAMEWGAPAPALRPYVHRYVGFLERTPAPLRRRELPSGDVHLIITFGPPWDYARLLRFQAAVEVLRQPAPSAYR
jgi:hypothetical protein